MTCFQGIGDGLLVDDATSGCVDEKATGSHAGDPGGVDQSFSGWHERNVQADDVGGFEQFVEVQQWDVGLCEVRVVCNDVHAQGGGALAHLLSDLPITDDTDGSASDFDADNPRPRPGAHPAVHGRDPSCQCQNEAYGQLGYRCCIGRACLHYWDGSGCCGFEIDVVGARAILDDRQKWAGVQDLCRHGVNANDQATTFGDQFGHFRSVEGSVLVGVPCLQTVI